MYNNTQDDKDKQQGTQGNAQTTQQPVAQGTQSNTLPGTAEQRAEWDKAVKDVDTLSNSQLDKSQDVDYSAERAQLRDSAYRQRKSATQSMLEMLNKRQAETRNDIDPSTLTQEQVDALSPEDYKRYRKQLRKQRVNASLYALADGISAIGNIVSTRLGGKSTYDSSQSLSKAWADRYEAQRKEREAKKDAYYNYEAQKQKLINEDADWEYKLKKDEDALSLKQREQDRKNAMARVQLARNMAAASKDEALTQYYDDMRANLAAGMTIKQAESNARIAYYRARTAHVGATGEKGGKSGGGKDYTETTENEYKQIKNPDGSVRNVRVKSTKKRVYNNGGGNGKSLQGRKFH